MTKVLILEDNVMIALVLRTAVTKLGLSYIHFVTPSQAIRKKAISKADIIISDFEMPPENALKLFEYMKNNKIQKPIIMYSGYTDIKEKIEKAGYKDLINEYLEKPAPIDKIFDCIKKYIK